MIWIVSWLYFNFLLLHNVCFQHFKRCLCWSELLQIPSFKHLICNQRRSNRFVKSIIHRRRASRDVSTSPSEPSQPQELNLTDMRPIAAGGRSYQFKNSVCKVCCHFPHYCSNFQDWSG